MATWSRSYEVHVVVRGVEGGSPVERTASLTELRDQAFLEALEPVRVVRSLRHAKSRARLQPVVSLGEVVACESRLEALRVIELDRGRRLEWIVAQPFEIVEFVNGRQARAHVPDLLYGLDDGCVVLENVRPLELRSRRFQEQEAMCGRLVCSLGWSYASVGSYEGMAATVLLYLWQFALVEPREEVVDRVMGALSEAAAWPLQRLVERCGRWEVVYPSVMAMVWRGDLEVPLEAALDAWTLVTVGKGIEA